MAKRANSIICRKFWCTSFVNSDDLEEWWRRSCEEMQIIIYSWMAIDTDRRVNNCIELARRMEAVCENNRCQSERKAIGKHFTCPPAIECECWFYAKIIARSLLLFPICLHLCYLPTPVVERSTCDMVSCLPSGESMGGKRATQNRNVTAN